MLPVEGSSRGLRVRFPGTRLPEDSAAPVLPSFLTDLQGISAIVQQQEQEAQRQAAEAEAWQQPTTSADRSDALNISGEEAYLRRGRYSLLPFG